MALFFAASEAVVNFSSLGIVLGLLGGGARLMGEEQVDVCDKVSLLIDYLLASKLRLELNRQV